MIRLVYRTRRSRDKWRIATWFEDFGEGDAPYRVLHVTLGTTTWGFDWAARGEDGTE